MKWRLVQEDLGLGQKMPNSGKFKLKKKKRTG